MKNNNSGTSIKKSAYTPLDRYFLLSSHDPYAIYRFLLLTFLTFFNLLVVIKSLFFLQSLFRQIFYAIVLASLTIYFFYSIITQTPYYRYSSYIITLWGIIEVLYLFLLDSKMLILMFTTIVIWLYFISIEVASDKIPSPLRKMTLKGALGDTPFTNTMIKDMFKLPTNQEDPEFIDPPLDDYPIRLKF